MTDTRPNILLVMTDQQRGDALGIEDHPVLETPYLDHVAASGIHFRRAYSACPVCIPARRTLMSGTKPATHGVFMNYNTLMDLPTLPGVLSQHGYQTHLVGKLHLHPKRKLYGFDSSDWADSPVQKEPGHVADDYQRFLIEHGLYGPDMGMGHGANQNGWVARPFHLEERFHFTNWCTQRALRFLERRDPTQPFLLKVSYHQPHEPCTPPAYYFRKYMDMDLPVPKVADWARVFAGPQRGLPVASWRTALEPRVLKQYMAGYYGTINHIDDQIGHILNHLPRNTIVLFTSDHGEMLGQHQWIRKRSAFEGSARIPFLMRFPENFQVQQRRQMQQVVELMDIMPTLLDAVGADIPDSVDGTSLMPLLRGEDAGWREYLHGECARLESLNSGMQYITDGARKYIYYPGNGEEQFFDLGRDPDEMINEIANPKYADAIQTYRHHLIEELKDRPEQFVKDGKLVPLGGPSPVCLPGLAGAEI